MAKQYRYYQDFHGIYVLQERVLLLWWMDAGYRFWSVSEAELLKMLRDKLTGDVEYKERQRKRKAFKKQYHYISTVEQIDARLKELVSVQKK